MSETKARAGLPVRRTSLSPAAPSMAGKPEEPPMRAADGSVRDWFKMRTAYQQFMRENEPLFKALAGSAEDPFPLLASGSFAVAADAAKAISVAAARAATGKAEPGTAEIRPFRTAAAMMAATAWQGGSLQSMDAEAIGAELASVERVVDEALDRSFFKETAVSQEISLSMTSMTVALRLMEPVMAYDFRRDRSELVTGMSTAVMAMAGEASRDVLGENPRPADRQSVVQTLANCLSSIMAQVYDRKSRQFLAHVLSMPRVEQEDFTRRYDPLPEVIASFRENARVFAGAAFASARAAAEVARPPENTPR